MTKPVIHNTGEYALTHEEYDKLKAVATNYQDRLLLMIGVSIGCRRSDIVNIRWENIDYTKHELRYTEKKKKNKIRVVPIPLALESEFRVIQSMLKQNSGKIFSFGERQSWTRFNDLCDLAGISRRPIHALRSTCIRFLMDKGFSVAESAKIIGDKESTVFDHYISASSSYLGDKMKDLSV